MNLNLWKTDSPALQVPESVLLLTLEKGSQSLAARRKAEYEIWEHSKKFIVLISVRLWNFKVGGS